MRTEEDLRVALRTLERHAPRPEAVLQPLRLRSGSGRSGRRRGWPRVMVPLAAAASVIALAAGALAAAGVITTGRARANHGNNGAAARAYAPPTVGGLPAYLLAVPLSVTGSPAPAALRSPHRRTAAGSQVVDLVVTATGRVAATASLPGRVSAIAATGTGTFYAAVTSGTATAFYEVQPPARGHTATVTRLPIPALPSLRVAMGPNNQQRQSPVAFLAASPDGSRLAISTYTWHGHMGDIQGLIVASTTTGSERVWTVPKADINGSMGPMTWLADGTLAINWLGFGSPTPASLRLLDTAAPGTDLLAGRTVAALNRNEFSDFTISPDGQILIGIADHPKNPAVLQGHPVPLGSAIEFTVRTGQAQVLYQTDAAGTGSCNDPLWMSSTGQEVLLECSRLVSQRQPGSVVTEVMLLEHGQVIKKLPWPSALTEERVALGG